MLAASTPPYWVVVILPVFATLISTGLLFAAFRPHFRDRQRHQAAEAEHRKRQDAAADAVLGREADPYIGRARIVGLVETVPKVREEIRTLQRTVGHVNGNGKSVMELIQDGVAETKVVKDALEIHITQDTHRFDEANRAIGANTATIAATNTQIAKLADEVREHNQRDHQEDQ